MFSSTFKFRVEGALYASSGWENSGGSDVTDAAFWSNTTGSPTICTDPIIAGSYSLKCPSGNNGVNKSLGATYPTLYAQTKVRILNFPSSTYYRVRVFGIGKLTNWNYALFVGAAKAEDGSIYWHIESGSYWTDNFIYHAGALSTNVTYVIEVKRSTVTPGNTTVLYVNGVEIENIPYQYYDADTVTLGENCGSGSSAVFDDFVLSDSYIGTAQTASSMTLNSPANNTETGVATQTFYYTPSCPDAIQGAALWMNISGTYQSVAVNATPVTDKTQNSITWYYSAGVLVMQYNNLNGAIAGVYATFTEGHFSQLYLGGDNKTDLLANMDCPVATNGTFTLANSVAEQTLLEFNVETTNITEVNQLYLDLDALTKNCTLKVYFKIDGTNYRESTAMRLTNLGSADQLALVLHELKLACDMKVTITSVELEGATRAVPYLYILTVW